MSIELGKSFEEEAEWEAPQTDEVKKDESEFGARAGLTRFLQKSGSKYLLPIAAMLSMWDGNIQESRADPAQDYLKYKNYTSIAIPAALTGEFGLAARQPDGSYVVRSQENLPQDNDPLGDLVYRSGQEIQLSSNPERAIRQDISNCKKELGRVCKDKKLATTLGNAIDNFATATFPDGYNNAGYLTVQRLNEQGKVETKPVRAQWATFQEANTVISAQMAKVRQPIYTIKASWREAVTRTTLGAYCRIVKDAAVSNLARGEATEQAGQK